MARVTDTLRSVDVLRRTGLLDLRHPVVATWSSLAMRPLGPIAGAA